MPTKKYKQKLLKHRICSVARVISCVAFLVLTIIGISSLVRAMSVTELATAMGSPAAWEENKTVEHPDEIVLPITYWDQRQDACGSAAQQFEWTACKIYGNGIQPGLVQNQLGGDELPVAAYASSSATKSAGVHETSQNVTTENFYRWFHEVEGLSKQISDRTVTFKRTGTGNKYVYGKSGNGGVFPLDDVDFSNDDDTTWTTDRRGSKTFNHNFHFTAHLQVPIRIEGNGNELFEFSGDDDVWVFLNGQLVLDIGGVHSAIKGEFTINTDGTVSSVVYDTGKYGTVKKNNININARPGDVVNLDFFYAERSTTESNTEITISEMTWPITAKSSLNTSIENVVVDENEIVVGNVIHHQATIANEDTSNAIDVTKIAAHITETYETTDNDGVTTTDTIAGFLPIDTISYTYTPEDSNSWQDIKVELPSASDDAFTLEYPLTLDRAGDAQDTLSVRYHTETSGDTGTMESDVSFYTVNGPDSNISHSRSTIQYAVPVYTIKVNYVVEGGDATAPAPATFQAKGGVDYNIPTPSLAGYTADKTAVAGTVLGDETYTVTYIRNPAYYYVTVNYVYENGDKAAEPYSEQLIENSDFNIESPIIEGYTADALTVTGTVNADRTITVTYTENPPVINYYNLKIEYYYEDGNEAAEAYTATLAENTPYSIDSPVIFDYTPNQTVVSGSLNASQVITVTYTKNIHSYTVTINYLDEDGNTVAEAYTASFEEGTDFEIPSPVVEGYTPDQDSIAGTIENAAQIFTVTYTKDPEEEEPEVPAPVEPVEPLAPIVRPRPTNPSEPSAPDDELTYTGPLGEVAIVVPNTGVISTVLSPIFEQYFADLILSQTFVLATLLIFSCSFAVYFSLRRYLNLTPAMAGRGHMTMQKTKMASAKSAKATNSAKTAKPSAKKSAATSKTKKK